MVQTKKLDNNEIASLCRAIAVAETSNCTKGTAITHNNCHGIKENHAFVRFDSKAASFRSCEWNWKKHYRSEFPTITDAERWTNKDKATVWLDHVTNNFQPL